MFFELISAYLFICHVVGFIFTTAAVAMAVNLMINDQKRKEFFGIVKMGLGMYEMLANKGGAGGGGGGAKAHVTSPHRVVMQPPARGDAARSESSVSEVAKALEAMENEEKKKEQ